jgi:hypothetical protein
MKKNIKHGAWSVRFFIRFFTVVLGVLFFWLLGFMLDDVESIKGPDYDNVEKQFVDKALVEKIGDTTAQIKNLERTIANKREQQQLVGASSENLKRTMDQLAELQRQTIQKQLAMSESDKERLSISLKQYLADQNSYQELNKDLLDLTSQKNQLAGDKQELDKQIEKQRESAREEYAKLYESHRLRLAFYQLAVLTPLLLVAGYLLLYKRGSVYYPLSLAAGGATLLKVALVMHEYFPSRYTKYVLILVLLGVTARILVHFIKIAAFPKLDWLLRQYREAYERFLCPVCEYPIRTGPRKYLYWTRRTINKTLPQNDASGKEEPYTCPACGTTLYEQCPSCHNIRHSLMEHCEHCGLRKEVQ